MSKTPIIFLVKNRALGDSLMGLSSVQYLKTILPQATVIYGTPAWIGPLYSKIKTDADLIYSFNLNNFKDFIELLKDLKRLKVTHIHEMHQSGRGGKWLRLIAILIGAKYSFHNHHLKSRTGVIDQGVTKPLIQRDLDGVYSFLSKSIGALPHYLDYIPKIQFEKDYSFNNADKKMVIFGVVATRETKQWPIEYFVELARLFKTNHPHLEIKIPLSKNSADQKIKKNILSLDLPSNIEVVEWSLDELPSRMNSGFLYIGNDTGLKHLAVALGLKTYTFFGPEPIMEWHPYDIEFHPVFFKDNLMCRTRTHHYCGLSKCDLIGEEYNQCLTYLKPELVLEKIHTTCKDFHH